MAKQPRQTAGERLTAAVEADWQLEPHEVHGEAHERLRRSRQARAAVGAWGGRG